MSTDPSLARYDAVDGHFTGGKLVSYDKLAQGDPLRARSATMQDVLDRRGITAVDGVQVYHWGTEFIPDADLIKAAGLSGKVIP